MAGFSKDKKVVQLVKRLELVSGELGISPMYEELESAFGTRGLRTIKTGDILASSSHKLIDANLQEAAFRSRATEIRVRATRSFNKMDSLLKTLKGYIKSKYTEELREKYKTVDGINSAISTIAVKYENKLSDLESLISVCDLYIADYDSAGYSLKRIQDALNLTVKDR